MQDTMTVDQFHMLQKWVPLVQAAGFYTPKMDLFSCFLLAGSIMKDPIVTQRWVAKAAAITKAATARGDEHPSVVQLPGATSVTAVYEQIVQAMTPEERRHLKQRIDATHSGLNK